MNRKMIFVCLIAVMAIVLALGVQAQYQCYFQQLCIQ